MLVEISNDYIEEILNFSISLAKHRKSDILEEKDIKFAIGKYFLFIINNNKFNI